MNAIQTQILRDIFQTQRIASLGTLHNGEPYVSMVPFALLPDRSAFVIHVSALAAHTKDMLTNPQVSLLVMAQQTPEISAQALPRVTIQGDALRVDEAAPAYADAKLAYLSKFSQSSTMFELADFSLFSITPRSIRVIGGFAQAATITPEAFARALGSP